MNSKTFTRDEIEELVDDDETIELPSEYLKHDIVLMTYIAKHEDKFWKFSFERSNNEGWLIYGDIDAVEVKKKEKVVIDWVEA